MGHIEEEKRLQNYKSDVGNQLGVVVDEVAEFMHLHLSNDGAFREAQGLRRGLVLASNLAVRGLIPDITRLLREIDPDYQPTHEGEQTNV